MNVIVIYDFGFINGGAGQVAVQSAKHLATLDIQVTYFSAVGPVDKIFENSNVRNVNLGIEDILNDKDRLRAMRNGIWNSYVSNEFGKLLDTFDSADTIIHIHGWSKAMSSSVFHLAKKRGFATLISLHDYFIACPNGGFFNFQKNEICTLKPMSTSCITCNCDNRSYVHKVWRVARQFVQNNIGRLPYDSSGYIEVSSFSGRILRPFLSKSAAIYRIENFINVPYEPKVDVSKNIFFTFLGRLSEEKGIQLFCEAINESETNNALVIGDGSLKVSLSEQYPGIEYTGWLSNNEVNENLKKSRCLIFPSLLYETGGLVVQEALALGVPCIVSDECAGASFIEDGINGLLFKRGSKDDLSKKINMMMDDDFVTTLSNNAFELYWKNPATIEKHCEQLMIAYSETLLNNRRQPK